MQPALLHITRHLSTSLGKTARTLGHILTPSNSGAHLELC